MIDTISKFLLLRREKISHVKIVKKTMQPPILCYLLDWMDIQQLDRSLTPPVSTAVFVPFLTPYIEEIPVFV